MKLFGWCIIGRRSGMNACIKYAEAFGRKIAKQNGYDPDDCAQDAAEAMTALHNRLGGLVRPDWLCAEIVKRIKQRESKT